MINIQQLITQNFERLLLFLISKAREELEAQGHKLTGSLERSLQFTIQGDLNKLIGSVYMADYGIYVDKGVKASRIPYSKGSGAKTSKYIAGLTDFFIKRGLDFKRARGAAFATAKKQKREGMPTRSSYAYSKNGRRLDFSRQVVTPANVNEATQLLNLAFVMQTIVSNSIGSQNITVNGNPQ